MRLWELSAGMTGLKADLSAEKLSAA
jgi:hypothetical protein